MDTFGHFFLSDQRTKETDKQELKAMKDSIAQRDQLELY